MVNRIAQEQLKRSALNNYLEVAQQSSVGKGTGLGLPIARQIVEENHGGKLSFNSTLGEGTEFAIELPISS